MPFLLFFFFASFLTVATALADEHEPRIHCGNAHLTPGKLKSLRAQGILTRPDLQQRHFSPSGRFLIHYDITGPNAVSVKDENSNSIPDYVDSAAAIFDYVWRVEIEEIGYRPPPQDTVSGAAYDIYLIDNLNGQYIYGLAYPDEEIRGSNPVRSTGYIILDNDYSERDSVMRNGRKTRAFADTSYVALKISAAHEFHHLVQFGYRSSPETSGAVIGEFTSTWMEYRVYPQYAVYEEFLPSLFRNLAEFTFSNTDPATGYRYAIFGQYIYKFYGDSLLKRTWELLGSGRDNTSAHSLLDSAFIERGSSLAESWCGFLPWMYFTGSRVQEDKFFRNAASFPEARFFYDSVYTIPSTTLSGILRPYELRFLRIRLPETSPGTSGIVDIALANIDTRSLISRSDQKQNYAIAITKSPGGGFKNITGTPYFLKIDHGNEICDTAFISGGITPIATAYPNPFKPRTDLEAFFPAPAESVISGRARLTLFAANMQPLYSEQLPVEVLENQFAVRWSNVPDAITSGIYIFAVETTDSRILGKIVIQR
ncbi:MAG TPA: MXAN_6640 family putative metalloprotease [Patescibacteria group bacterium]|nr:MXAN_6640 family putative metalloprotease [Patescibacteria group bacterium]